MVDERLVDELVVLESLLEARWTPTSALMCLDLTGTGPGRWTMRWKATLNAFDITFDQRALGRLMRGVLILDEHWIDGAFAEILVGSTE